MTSGQFDPHIRPIALRKDLLHIANLIDLCFADNMDAEGRDYIRHIRQIAQNLGNFFAEGTTPENSQLPFHGYVWQENGEIIGNLTLIQVRKIDKFTYLIANVAVRPEWRGKGIGRQLTERAITHVREHGGKTIHLQVREDNPIAVHIYQSLGFGEYARRTTWTWLANTKLAQIDANDFQIRKRKADEWSQHKEWLRRTYPWSLTWNLPFNLERLKPGLLNWLSVFINGGDVRGWTAFRQEHNVGTAVWERGVTGSDYVWLGINPDVEIEAISTLLRMTYQKISRPSRITINYPSGQAKEAFTGSGMKAENTLIWMKRSLLAVEHPPE